MSLVETLARRRVALGFLAAAAALLFAHPTLFTWRIGFVVAVCGEAIRIWAAGHLEKGSEITRSGPYRWTRHPLYLGSSIVAVGVVIAARNVVVAALIAIYMASTNQTYAYPAPLGGRSADAWGVVPLFAVAAAVQAVTIATLIPLDLDRAARVYAGPGPK